MNPATSVVVHLGLCVAGVSLVWWVQTRTRNAGVIDAIWPLLIGAGAVLYATTGPGNAALRAATAVLGAAWALRLGGFLWWRNVGQPEDRRYAELRAAWGTGVNLRMYVFFVFQAVVAWIVALSFIPATLQSNPPTALVAMGVSIGLSGILGEGLADQQLSTFRRNPANRGRVCDQGLWRYSRHPNYFFECVFWLAWPLLAIGAPWGGLGLVGPVVIVALLLKFSGIPSIESRPASARRSGYAEYVERTSAFIPMPPKTRQ